MPYGLTPTYPRIRGLFKLDTNLTLSKKMVDDILGKHAQSSAQSGNFDTNLIQYPQSALQHHGERLCVGGLQRQTESCRQEWEGQTDLLGQSNINCIEH